MVQGWFRGLGFRVQEICWASVKGCRSKVSPVGVSSGWTFMRLLGVVKDVQALLFRLIRGLGRMCAWVYFGATVTAPKDLEELFSDRKGPGAIAGVAVLVRTVAVARSANSGRHNRVPARFGAFED